MDYVDNGATLMLRLSSGENHMVDERDPGNYFRIRFSSQDFAVKNVNDRLERRDRNHRSDREMPVEMMMNVIKEANENYRRIMDESQRSLFPDLDALLKILPGDSIVPATSTIELKTDTLRRVRAVSEIAVREKSRSRIVERTFDRLENEEKRQSQYWVEVHKKFSTSFACIVFVLIGAPLGIMARKGGIGTGVIYSIAFFVIYWVSLIGGENLADRLIVSPVFAMWISNVFMGSIGIFLTYRMTRDRYSGDSRLLRILFWLRRFSFGKNQKEGRS
jgi:lipopolysaccharide export system permease protein